MNSSLTSVFRVGRRGLYFFALVLLMTEFVEASELDSPNSANQVLSVKDTKRLGFDIGLLGAPHPALMSVSLGYHFLEFLRFSGGVGFMNRSDEALKTYGTTVGVEVRGFLPKQDFSPTCGFGLSSIHISSETTDGKPSATSLPLSGFDQSGSQVYLLAGVDWVSTTGMHFEVAYQVSLRAGIHGTPVIQAGWYFDSF